MLFSLFYTMNYDTLSCILEFSQLRDLIHCSLVSKQFYHVTNNELIWKLLFNHTFKNNPVDNNFKAHSQDEGDLNCSVKTNPLKMGHFKYNYIKHYNIDAFLHKFNMDFNKCLLMDTLDLESRLVKHIPNEIELLTNLKILELQCTQLLSIPNEIGSLRMLHTLYLNNNQLQHIPRQIGLLTNLRKINLYHNQLQYITGKIGLLTNLQTLSLHHNQLQYIPKEIGLLTDLRVLCLDYNQLQNIPS